MSRHHLYLISDSTGETVQSIGRACTVQFEQVEIVEHLWPMVRSPRALEIVIEELEEEPGLVLYTLLDRGLAETLEDYCKRRSLTCVSVIDPFIEVMATYFGEKSRDMPGRQHELDDEYFQRIDAITYVMQHDDGQQTGNLEEADVVLVGVSRTSKTPTSIYLANRGIKAANVPIVPDQPLPEILFDLNHPLVVGLTEDPRRLVDLRRSRMRQSLGGTETAYTDIDAVRKEVADARRLFGRYGWPVIDVTRRSIEETAAAIMRLVRDRDRRVEEGADADLLSSNMLNPARPGRSVPGAAVAETAPLARPDAPALILASGSRTRATMLKNAGLAFDIEPAGVDEAAVKRRLAAEDAPPGRVADTLAEMKAAQISGKIARRRPGALVLGADQVLDLDGAILDKPADRAAASAHLRRLSGRRHRLVSAAVLMQDGQRIWDCTDCAGLAVRPLTDRFIAAYLDAVGEDALDSVGAYRLEGLGAHLFASVEGDYFTILGLPLLPLLEFLRGYRALEP